MSSAVRTLWVVSVGGVEPTVDRGRVIRLLEMRALEELFALLCEASRRAPEDEEIRRSVAVLEDYFSRDASA